MEFKYIFAKRGSLLDTHKNAYLSPQRNRILLDIGNDLRLGVIDTAHLLGGVMVDGQQLKSSTAVLAKFPFLVLDNIDSDANYIEIVMHEDLDLDCIAATYLTKYLIEHKELPANTTYLLNYVEQVVKGLVMINKYTIASPAAIVCAISEVIKKENNIYDKEELWECSLKRGIGLIKYIMNRLDKMALRERSLFHPGLIPSPSPYEKEIDLLKNDHEKYENELGDSGWTEKTRMRIPIKTEFGEELEEVDALFWRRPPNCILHKHWARGDKGASIDAKGFIFTFIPFENETKKLEDKGIYLPTGQTTVEVSKVIISVNPAFSYCLTGLAGALEKLECERELAILGEENSKKWRSRESIRYPEDSWCNNDDPWFYGYDSTIVDAPRAGSLLTVDEINAVTRKFSKPTLESHKAKLVVPFAFSHKIFTELVAWCNNADNIDKIKPLENEVLKTMLPNVADYLRLDNRKQGKLPNSIIFKLDCKEKLEHYLHEIIIMEEGVNKRREKQIYIEECPEILTIMEAAASKDESLGGATSGELPFIINDYYAIVFGYGCGYVIIDTHLKVKDNVMTLDQGMLFNKQLIQNGERIFKEVLLANESIFKKITCLVSSEKEKSSNQGDLSLPWELEVLGKPLIYTSTAIKQNSLYKTTAKEMIYKLSGGLSWGESFASTRYYESIADENILELDEGVLYSFAPTGGALLLMQGDYNKIMDSEQKKFLQGEAIYSFYELDFWSFLLALHQKHTLLRMSNDLAVYVSSNNKKKVAELRYLLLEFIAIGRFGQVSYNKTSILIYRCWQDVLENQDLFEQVFMELAAVDDYISMKRSRRIEIITAAALPIIIIGTIFGTNFQEIWKLPLWPWWGLGILGTLSLIWGVWYWFSLRN